MAQHDQRDGRGPRSAKQQVPIGLEKLLLIAAREPEFKQRLLRERLGAVAARGLTLRPSEQTTLRAIPQAQLRASIERLDASPQNVQRRRFLGAVAATATAVVAAETFGGCDLGASDGSRPDVDGRVPTADAGVDGAAKSDSAAQDAGAIDIADMGTGIDAGGANGIRPGG